MAKRSYIQAIRSKQTSVYSKQRTHVEAIHAIDGSSKREVSRRFDPALRSWTSRKAYVDEAMMDAQAEKQMNPHGWSSKKNPICQSCFIQTAINGSCGCNE